MTFSTSVAPLRYAPFRSLWLASVASNAGTFVQTVAASWLMQELTGSPLWVAAMAASGTLPAPLPRPPRRGTRRHPRSAEGDACVPGGDGDRRHRYGSARLPRVAQPTAPARAGAAARGGGRLQPPRMAGHGSRPRPPRVGGQRGGAQLRGVQRRAGGGPCTGRFVGCRRRRWVGLSHQQPLLSWR